MFHCNTINLVSVYIDKFILKIKKYLRLSSLSVAASVVSAVTKEKKKIYQNREKRMA